VWKLLNKGMPQDLEEIIQFMELQESADMRSRPRQRLRLRTTTTIAASMVGTKLVATSARVTLTRMKEVPRRLRSTVISVTSTVALQTPITPMTAASTRRTVVRRDSLVERRSRTIASLSSRRSSRRR